MPRRTILLAAIAAATFALAAAIASAWPAPPSPWTYLNLDNDTQPQAVALSGDGLRAFTANYYSGTVSVVDTATGARLDPVNLPGVAGANLKGIVVNHAGTRAYVTGGSKVWTIDITSDPAVTVGSPVVVHAGSGNGAITISPDDTTLYVAENSGSHSIAKIAVGTGAVTESGAIFDDIQQMALTPDGLTLYATTWDHGLVPVTTAGLEPGTQINVGGANLNGVAIDPAGTHVYAVAEDGPCGAGCLKVVALPSHVVSSVDIGGRARGVAVSNDGSTVFAGLNSGGDVISVPADASAPFQTLATNVQVQRGIAVDPGGAAIYVTSYNDGPAGCDYGNPPAPECHSGALYSLRFPAPGAPTSLAATPGDRSAAIAFVAGTPNGTTVTNTEYSLDGGPWTPAAPATTTGPVAITGLVNGTTYSVRLRSRSGTVAGPRSAAVSVTPVAPTPEPSGGGTGGASATSTPAAPNPDRPSHPVVPPLAPPLTAHVRASGTYETVGVVPDGATSVVQSATQGGTTSSAKRALSRGMARTRVRSRCPITSDSGTRTYHCSIRLGGGTWVVTTRAMRGSTVVASSTRRVRVTVRPRRAVTG